MTTAIPRVSIGLPVYNGEKYLRSALDSILKQDYTGFELIISDNASTDSTPDICREFAAKDERIRYYRNETNLGASANFTNVFKLSKGELFKWAAYDDIHLPGFLRRCVEVFDQVPTTVVLVAPRTEVIDADGRSLPYPVERLNTESHRPHRRIAEMLRKVAWATAAFGLVRADALRKTRLIDAFYGSDCVLLAELALLGEIREIPEVLFQRRFHPEISTQVYKNPNDMAAWFDPSKKIRKHFLSPNLRLGVEYLRSINRMPLHVFERFLCYASVVAVWGARECRRMTLEYRGKIRLGTRLKTFLSLKSASR